MRYRWKRRCSVLADLLEGARRNPFCEKPYGLFSDLERVPRLAAVDSFDPRSIAFPIALET
jgi:hypothetical protein